MEINKQEIIKKLKTPTADAKFKSEKHKLAKEISTYFNERFSLWIIYVDKSYKNAGQIRHEFEHLKKKEEKSKKDIVKMLMKWL